MSPGHGSAHDELELSRVGTPEQLLRQAAGWLFPGATTIAPLGDREDAVALIDRATAEGLLGPLLLVADNRALELPDELVERLVALHEQAMLWCLQVEVSLLEVRSWFAAAGGIDHLVIKGSAVAHLDEPDPSLRSFADVDLLVPGPQMTQALDVLIAHGGTRAYVERRPGFDRRFVKSVTVRLDHGVEVDVHRTLCDGTHGFRIPLDRLFADATTFPLGGEDVPTLSRPHRALHAAYHAVLGSTVPPLRTLRDLAGYLTSDDLPPEVLAVEAREWRGEAVLAEAVGATFAAFPIDAPAWRRWLDEVVIDARETRIVTEQQAESGSFGLAKVAAMRELSMRDRFAFGLALAVPSKEHLASRGVTRADVTRTALSRLLAAARR